MAPAPPEAAKLFHPKSKKKGPVGIYGMNPSRSASPQKQKAPSNPSTPPARPSPKPEQQAVATPSLPEGPFTDYTLVSSALNGWKYDVMKFDSRKPVDILRWATPVKLNRKDIRRPDTTVSGPEPPKAVGPMLGPDGKPVIGMDGRIVMVDAEGKPIHGDGASGSSKSKNGTGTGPKRKFQKKTKQVFKVPEATRQLRKEERYPWVMEDVTGTEVWVGKMEEVVKAETQAFFMPASNNTFKFVPAHRWYKFQKKPNYHIPNLEEAESLMAMRQRNKDPERWLLQKRGGQGPSAATSALLKTEPSDGSLGSGSGQSLGPGGRRLRTVVDGAAGLFGDDDEDDQSRRRDLGQDADYDEVPYHEDFADDEEKVVPEDHQEDELEKEMEERLQREYMSANKQRDGGIDVSDDEDNDPALTGAGKAIRKLMNKHEKNEAYESDEESNPYASSVEEEEEEEPIIADGPAVQQQFTPSRASASDTASSQTTPVPSSRPAATSTPNSRAASPNPGHGGHLVVAKRATSPKAPKPRVLPNGLRAGSPLVLVATSSPNGTDALPGRGGSPGPSSLTQRAPSGAAKLGSKRKADEPDDVASAPSPVASGAGGQPKPKKRRATAAMLGPDGQPIELEDSMVIEWLRNTPNAKTRDCISHFTPYLRTDEQKAKFTALIKEVAQLKNGILVLRSAYRGGSGVGSKAPSPSPMDTK
ncbi:hypothetical protein BJV78DRAFT_1187535 [Lactifluus subvellereus]|nr:hypothetical protein BJV78DRAFT_1187535 [Lactifluus subvellereus]